MAGIVPDDTLKGAIMSQSPTPEEQKRRIRERFNTMASGYDSLTFVKVVAGKLLELVDLKPGMRVLDVGTGTGMVAMAAAQAVGPTGRVIGHDLAPEMIAAAQAKAAASGLTQIDFRLGDAEHLPFPDESFDAVMFASSLFFVPDIPGALREARRVLAPGGWVAFTCFAEQFMSPLLDLWVARTARYGIAASPRPHSRLVDPAVCAARLREAGFERADAHTEALGFYLPSVEARWNQLTVGLDGNALHLLTAEQVEQIRAEHMAELEALVTPQGIWFDVSTNYAFGWKKA